MAIENEGDVRRLLRRAVDAPADAVDDLPALLAALDHADRQVRVGAAWAVCAVASERPELAPSLVDRLGGRSGTAAGLAADWIGRELGGAAASNPAAPGTSGEEERSTGATDSTRTGSAGAPATGPGTGPTRSGDSERGSVSGVDSGGADPDRADSSGVDSGPTDSDETDAEPAGSDDTDTGASGSRERSDPVPSRIDEVVRNERFTIELDRTVFDALEIVDRVASDRHSWTYVGMASIDAERRAVLVRTYRPPRGARSPSFAAAFEEVLRDWDGVDDHDGVLTVHDYGRRPHPWVVTEYASETLRSAGRLPLEAALRVGLDAATALAHAHERGVTHRSLDPRSVALDRREDRPVGRLLNLGIVDVFRAVDGPLPLDSRYAAPELFGDDHGSIDWLTDVYHLGAVLYTAFTGRPPYDDSLVVRGGPAGLAYEPPSSVVEGLPVAADRIVAKAMATHKIARYESADEFARDLQSALAEVEGDA